MCPSRSSEKGHHEDRFSPSSFHLALGAQPSDPSRGEGGRWKWRRRRAAGSQGPLQQLPTTAARPGPCPRPRGTDPEVRSVPRAGPPCGSPDPALDSPLSTSLPFLAVAAFPITGALERRGQGGKPGLGPSPPLRRLRQHPLLHGSDR